jgi:hypothetical protein
MGGEIVTVMMSGSGSYGFSSASSVTYGVLKKKVVSRVDGVEPARKSAGSH